ncbi:unnamed protein product [Moneuplotes crassus]|uniref:Uncharacterized protein n=1 Tax=Euplotes crassus TaxID=5936 RepID=A0AAD1XRC9_EUPCR|nr:unnamed protein product [Moneuplotes crassus]
MLSSRFIRSLTLTRSVFRPSTKFSLLKTSSVRFFCTNKPPKTDYKESPIKESHEDSKSPKEEDEYKEKAQENEPPTTTPQQDLRIHPYWYFITSMVVIYQFLKMNDITVEFEDLIKYLKEQPFKAVDIAVNLKKNSDYSVFVTVEGTDIDGRVLSAESEAENRFRKILAMSSDSGLLRLCYLVLFTNFCGIISQIMYHQKRGFNSKAYIGLIACGGFVAFSTSQTISTLNFLKEFGNLKEDRPQGYVKFVKSSEFHNQVGNYTRVERN